MYTDEFLSASIAAGQGRMRFDSSVFICTHVCQKYSIDNFLLDCSVLPIEFSQCIGDSRCLHLARSHVIQEVVVNRRTSPLV